MVVLMCEQAPVELKAFIFLTPCGFWVQGNFIHQSGASRKQGSEMLSETGPSYTSPFSMEVLPWSVQMQHQSLTPSRSYSPLLYCIFHFLIGGKPLFSPLLIYWISNTTPEGTQKMLTPICWTYCMLFTEVNCVTKLINSVYLWQLLSCYL